LQWVSVLFNSKMEPLVHRHHHICNIYLEQICGFIRIFQFPVCHDTSEILLKVVLNTHNPTSNDQLFSYIILHWGPSWSWSYGSWIYDYICNQCPSPLALWVRIPLRGGVLDTTLYDKVFQWLAAGGWFFSGYSGFLHQ
jgi:hypothetical protein